MSDIEWLYSLIEPDNDYLYQFLERLAVLEEIELDKARHQAFKDLFYVKIRSRF